MDVLNFIFFHLKDFFYYIYYIYTIFYLKKYISGGRGRLYELNSMS